MATPPFRSIPIENGYFSRPWVAWFSSIPMSGGRSSDASSVSYVPSSGQGATNVQDAIDQLNEQKQPSNSRLTALAGSPLGTGYLKWTGAGFTTEMMPGGFVPYVGADKDVDLNGHNITGNSDATLSTPGDDTAVPSQKAVKEYADTKEPDLGLPTGNGYVLVGDMDGERRWVDQETFDWQTHSNNLDSLSELVWASGSPFIKMTGANTFSLDANIYLTSDIWNSPIIITDNTISTSSSSGGALNTVGTISTQVETTFTASTTYYPGTYVKVIHNPSTASGSSVYAGRWEVSTLSTTTSDISSFRAGSFVATHAGTGDVTSGIVCAYFDAVVAATAGGTISTLTANYCRANILGAVNITNAYAARQDMVVNNASLTITTARLWGAAVTFSAGTIGTLVGVDVPALSCVSLTSVAAGVYAFRSGAINAAAGTVAPNAAAIKTGNVSGATTNKQLDLGTAVSTFADTTECTGSGTGSIQTLGGIYAAKIGWFAGGGHFGGPTHYTAIESDGTIVMNGDATVWKDIQYSISSGKVGVANVPTWSTFISPMSEYTFAVSDTIDLGSQEIIHEYKEGTDLVPHIHWVLNGAAGGTARKVQWQIDYTWCNTGSSTWTTSSKVVEITTSSSAADKTHYLSSFPAISGVGITIGAQLKIKLSRIAKSAGGNDPAANPFVLQVGVHVECDTVGSRTVSSK